MIMVEIDCDDEHQAMMADLLEHLLDTYPHQYSVSIQG